MIISLRDIRELCGDTFYYRGKSYYDARRVQQLKFNEDRQRYTAQVKGSTTYKVQIDLDDDGFMDTYCTCPAFEDYTSCKHIAATLIAINGMQGELDPASRFGDQGSIKSALTPALPSKPASAQTAKITVKSPAKESYQTANQMLSIFKSALPRDTSSSSGLVTFKDKLQLEYIFSIRGGAGLLLANLALEIRVGVKRLYVVAKLRQFLEAVEQQKSLYFTSHFTYDPGRQMLDEADAKFLQTLIFMKNSEKLYKNAGSGYYGYSNPADGREIMVDPFAWERVRPLLPKVNAILEGAGGPVQLALSEDSLPLHFSVGKEGADDYRLLITGLDKLKLIPDLSCAVMDGRIYQQDPSTFNLIVQLKQKFHSTQKIEISPMQIDEFIQHALPRLRAVGEIRMEKNVRERIVEPTLQSKLYLDYAETSLTARLEFHYDAIMIQPLSEEQSVARSNDIILVRNVQAEEELLQIMDHSPLHRSHGVWTTVSESGIYETLYELIPVLEHKAAIYLSQSAQNLVLERKPQPKVKAELSEGLDWLEVSFELEGLDEQEMKQMMQAIVEKKRYIRLRSGAFVSLEEERFAGFRDIAEHLSLGKKDIRQTQLRLPSFRALQLPERPQSTKHVKWGKSLRLFLEQLKDPESMDFAVPGHLEPVLRDYQVKGFQWMKTLSHFRFGGILADDMGLGKTIQSIAYICSELAEMPESGRSPILIVSPASLTYNWANEFARFAPGVKVLVSAGQKAERAEALNGLEEAEVVITSYPLLRRDIEFYDGRVFHALILDEAQAVKNSASQTAQVVQSVSAARRFALTGTPIENSLDELWAIFNAIFPLLFSSQKTFRDLPGEKIANRVAPFIMRRLKKEVLEELPDRIDTVQRSELADEQKKLYLAYLSKLQKDTEQDLQTEGFHKSRMKILAGITRLRQLCCHPALFIENYTGGSGKLEQLEETVEECLASGRRLLIFSQFSSMLKLIRDSLEDSGKKLFYLDGATPSVERVELCRRFNEGGADIFLISLKAGGTGLNLTGADTVILYDLWWNPAVEEQAIGRAHRMGQRNVVQVIRMVTEGSIEEKILELQERKKNLIEEVIEPGDGAVSRLSEQDIRELLKM